MDTPDLPPAPRRTAEQEARIRDHVEDHREALRRATAAVIRSAGPWLLGDVQVGMDPALEAPVAWWARVELRASRGGRREVLVERYPNAVEALEALVRRLQGLRRLQ